MQTRFEISFVSYFVMADKQSGPRDKKSLVLITYSCFSTQRDGKTENLFR